MVKVNSNNILVKPMSSCKTDKMQRAYLALLNYIKQTGVIPKKHVFDNKFSNSMKKLICKTCQLKLVTPYFHCRNVADVDIKNFKTHYISISVSVDNNLPIFLWDELLPQTKLTLNLLHQANVNPNILAHAFLFGLFDFNRPP